MISFICKFSKKILEHNHCPKFVKISLKTIQCKLQL